MSRRTYINESHRRYSEECQKAVEEMTKHPLTWEQFQEQSQQNRRSALESYSFIFLDIDGVLTSGDYHSILRDAGLPVKDADGPLFSPFAVKSLEAIFKVVPEARLVISSSWGLMGWGRMKGIWTRRRLPGHIVGVTEGQDNIKELVESYGKGENPVIRGAEIRNWLKSRQLEESSYVIIDDTLDFYEDQLPHFVQINPQTGITQDDAMMAVNILRKSQI